MEFVNKHIVKILSALLILFALLYMQQCSNLNRIEKLEKQSKTTNQKLDSIPNLVEFGKMLKVEGLKAEKRMIQATDRKILDVNRQTQIDEEIKKLEE
jgi:cell division protein FtsB